MQSLVRIGRRVVVALSAALLLTGPVAAQSGTVTGRVSGPNGSAIVSAKVSVRGTGVTTSTDRSGGFRLTGVPSGQQTLTFEYVGLQPVSRTVSITPGAAQQLNVTMQMSAVAVEGITVTGERAGQLRSINEQKASATVVNVISADEMGQLPDQNVAEATQRVSGVYVQTDRGEGRYVSIRGTAPRLNTVTLNGQTLASTENSRAVTLDLLPADLVSGIEVTKAITPDMDGNAVGGTINIKTLTAFDRPRPFMIGSIEGMYHHQQVDYLDDKQPFEASLMTGRRFGQDGNWGFVLGGNLSRRDFTASVLDPDGWVDRGGNIVPSEIEMQIEDNERTRYGFNSSLDWRPRQGTTVSLRGLYTFTQEVDSNSESELTFLEVPTMLSPTLAEFAAGSLELDLSQGDNRRSISTVALQAEHELSDAFTLDVSGNISRGLLNGTSPDAVFESPANVEPQLGARVDISRYYFGIEAENEALLRNPSVYPISVMNFNTRRNLDEAMTAAANLRWDVNLGSLPAFLKLGVKGQLRDKTINADQTRYNPGATATTLESFSLPPTGVQGGYTSFAHGDANQFITFVGENRDDPNLFTVNPFFTQYKSADRDSENFEDVYAGYLMGSTDIGPLTVMGGARVERTVAQSTRSEVIANRNAQRITSIGERTVRKEYTNVLPSVIVKYSPFESLVVRGAWTHSIGRPDFPELAGVYDANIRTVGGRTDLFTGTILQGNQDLKPYRSTNFDATAEYYFSFGGMLSASGFHKKIKDPIYDYDVTERNFMYEGQLFQQLRFVQDRNADEGILRGIEFAYAQALVFLPRPLDGLGITANVALIDSEVELIAPKTSATAPVREDKIPFFGQSGKVVNVIPYYQRGPVEMRLAWSYRGEYLDLIGGQPFQDKYMDSRSTIDLSASLQLPDDRFQLYGQARNITDEPEIGYQGLRNRFDLHVLTGRTYSLGLRAKL